MKSQGLSMQKKDHYNPLKKLNILIISIISPNIWKYLIITDLATKTIKLMSHNQQWSTQKSVKNTLGI